MECLRSTSEKSIELDIQPETEAVFVNGAAWVYLYFQRDSKRFKEYIVDEVIKPLLDINPLSANPTKWQNTLKQFVGNSQRIV